MNPDLHYVEPDEIDYEALDAEQDTRMADRADQERKGA
jgi:hypothetical protein